MAGKRELHLDPEYEALPVELQEKRIKLYEDSVRKQMKDRIVNVLKTNFEQEINSKDAEVDAVDESLHATQAVLDRLRACVVTKFYASLGQDQKPDTNFVPSIHPTIKKYLDTSVVKEGNCEHVMNTGTSKDSSLNSIGSAGGCIKLSSSDNSSVSSQTNNTATSNQFFSNENNYSGSRLKSKCKIIVGNISKFIPPWQRNESDQSTHRWMVYVRGDKENPDIDGIVKKVRFLLHNTYRPNDVVEISTPPFHLVKRGWGEFPVRVQIYFHDSRNKPLDIPHQLKLDKTFTGLQTLGAETVVELQLYKAENYSHNPKTNFHLPSTPSTSTNSVLSFNSFVDNFDSCSSTKLDPAINVKMEIDIDSETNVNPHIHETILAKEKTSVEIMKLDAGVSNSTISNNLTSGEVLTTNTISYSSNKTVDLTSNSSSSTSVTNSIPVNSIPIKKDNAVNGVNATFVKCTDNDGRVLLVPQSSLVRIKTDKLNAVKANNNNLLNNFKSVTSGLKNSKVIVPSYIVKVVPNKDNNQKQVMLIPMAEKKVQLKDIKKFPVLPKQKLAIENNVQNIKNTSVINTAVVEKPKPKLTWEQEVENINVNDYKSYLDLLKRVTKSFPIVKTGVDRNLYPFCASSLEEYLRWNIGKQRASEWRRAGLVRSSLINLINKNTITNLTTENVWSRRDIMMWCRKNGFVPMSTEKMFLLPEPKWSGVELCSISNSDELISTLKEENHANAAVPDEEEIEIVEFIKEKPSKPDRNQSQSCTFYMPPLNEATLYVKEVTSQIGVSIKPVELEPSLCAPVIEEMILAACKQLATNLIENAVNEGFNRLGGKLCPEEITVSDVYSAIKSNLQFDFLTNNFLGKLKDSDADT